MMIGPIIGLALLTRLDRTDRNSYLNGIIGIIIILAVFVIISFLLSIPGLKEEEWLKESYFKEEIEKTEFLPQFKNNIKQALKQKPFVVMAIVSLCTTVSLALISASQPYYVAYVLGRTTEFGQTVFLLAITFVLVTVVFIPVRKHESVFSMLCICRILGIRFR